MKTLKNAVLFFILITVRRCYSKPMADCEGRESPNYNRFASNIFSAIVEGKSVQNIVYSPASIHNCMALIFMGSEGVTAEEMRQVLKLGTGDKIFIAEHFRTFLHSNRSSDHAVDHDNVPKLKMANRLYVNEKFNVSNQFKKISTEYFDTETEKVNFGDYKTVVRNANQWVAQQTKNNIKDILKNDGDAFNSDTTAVLINAIYFKGNWLHPFSQSSTSKAKFFTHLNDSKEVEFMYNEKYYGYAELKELEATVLEMPYNNSDISMLIILPHEIQGLRNLELKLKNKDLHDIYNQILLKKVHAYIPKFTIEFDIDLRDPLEKMGLTTTFTKRGNFESLFTTPINQNIADVRHKAFLDVNEAGSKAAATTFATLTTLSSSFDEPVFFADHPFVFAICSKSAVYFAGHVARL